VEDLQSLGDHGSEVFQNDRDSWLQSENFYRFTGEPFFTYFLDDKSVEPLDGKTFLHNESLVHLSYLFALFTQRKVCDLRT
jgi:hypothetical protein